MMAEVKKVVHVDKKAEKAHVTVSKQAHTQLELSVSHALTDIAHHLDPEFKKPAELLKVIKAVNVNYGKDKQAVVVYLHYRAHKVLTISKFYKKLIEEVEKRLRKTVLFLSNRHIESKWIKKNRKQKRPYSRTLTSVFSAILDELVLPSAILGARTRVRLDGSALHKITLDKNDEPFLEERVEAIQFIYRKLTTREVVFDFQKEQTFYTLKKGEKK